MPAAVVKDGTVTPKFRQGKISPPFLTAKFSPRNSPLAKFPPPPVKLAVTNSLTARHRRSAFRPRLWGRGRRPTRCPGIVPTHFAPQAGRHSDISYLSHPPSPPVQPPLGTHPSSPRGNNCPCWPQRAHLREGVRSKAPNTLNSCLSTCALHIGIPKMGTPVPKAWSMAIG